MQKKDLTKLAVIALGVMLVADTAWAQRGNGRGADPAAVAERCAEKIAKFGDQAAKRSSNIATECVAEIDLLLAEGDIEGALETGDNCIAVIQRLSQKSCDIIEHLASKCEQMLTRLEADEATIAVVTDAVAAAKSVIEEAEAAALAEIEAALPAAE